jgi:uncharacterized peroxidase-related enzyme
MAHIEPLSPDQIPDDMLDMSSVFEQRMGFRANSGLTMMRRPELVKALGGLARVVYRPSENVPLSLRNMIAHMTSQTAGCMYCAAHTASNTLRPESGVEPKKLEQIWHYETSPLFSEKERVALRFAQHASSIPNAVTDADFDRMRVYFSDEDIVDIVALIGYFGFLNRWNDTMATELEELPQSIGEAHLTGSGWRAGKHAAG